MNINIQTILPLIQQMGITAAPWFMTKVGLAEHIAMTMDLRQRPAVAPDCHVRGKHLNGTGFATVTSDGVAIIPVLGPLSRMYSRMSFSYEEITRDLSVALNDPDVSAILLDIDSGGGMAAGVDEAAHAIRAAAEQKPMTAYVGGMAASAAYWLAAAAPEIVMGANALAGSVGVVIEYHELGGILEKMGASKIEVVASQSPNKRLSPGSDEGRAEMQALVDASAVRFIDGLAEFRGITPQEVMDRFGQGMIFESGDAIKRGMADRIGSFQEVLTELAAGRKDTQIGPASATRPAAKEPNQMDWNDIDAAGLKEHRPDLITTITTGFIPASEAKTEAEMDAAVKAERARIASIDEATLPGYGAMAATAKEDGTSPETFALALIKAEKGKGADHIASLVKQEKENSKIPPAPPPESSASKVDPSLPVDDRCKAKWDQSPDIREEFGTLSIYTAFIKAEEDGKVKMLKMAS